MTHSISLVGKCNDNDSMEGIWKIMKCKLHLKISMKINKLLMSIFIFGSERITLKMVDSVLYKINHLIYLLILSNVFNYEIIF